MYIAAIVQHHLAPGETGFVSCSLLHVRSSVAFQYVEGFLEASPILRQQIESMTADEVRLKGNIVISVHAGSYRTIRGRTLLAVVGDETIFWRDIDSAQPDVEIFRACAARARRHRRSLGRYLDRLSQARSAVSEVA